MLALLLIAFSLGLSNFAASIAIGISGVALRRSMTTARYGAVAAPLPGGDVLIAGGGNNKGDRASSFLSSAELFRWRVGRPT